MNTKTAATIDDLYGVPGKAELVGGEIVMMPPTGGLPGYAASQIMVALGQFARQTGRGYAIGDNVGFVVNLPHRKSFSPNAAFYLGQLSMKFLEGAPAFAVEVRDAGDYGLTAERAMSDKRADYFAAGTIVVWDIDLLSEDVVRVYRSSDRDVPTVYRRGEFAEAEPALPGWKMPADDLFPPSQAP